MLLSAASSGQPESALVVAGAICMTLGILRVLSLLTSWGRKAGFGSVPVAFSLGAALTVVGYVLIMSGS